MCLSAKIQTVELDNLNQHGFDFQLAVLNEVCFIILRVRAKRIDANVLTLTRMNYVMYCVVGPRGPLEKALEVVFVGGRKPESSSKICSSLDIGGTGGDRGCLPKGLAALGRSSPNPGNYTCPQEGVEGMEGDGQLEYEFIFPFLPAVYKIT